MVKPSAAKTGAPGFAEVRDFAIKDCALVALATGKKAHGLQEFHNLLAAVDETSIYHHFWGSLLQARFEEREYNNDFAAWIRHELHDQELAERLAVLDPTAYSDLDQLRHDILELIETRIEEAEYLRTTRVAHPFVFLCSQIVVFDTHQRLDDPVELAVALSTLSTSSVFYHFIDARRRTDDGRDDFSDWLQAFGDTYDYLREQLADIDPYFGNLSDLRQRLVDLCNSYFKRRAL